MPYTWGLLGSIADVAGDAGKPLVPIPGTPPSLLNPPIGLRVPPAVPAHRQGAEGNRCSTELPELRQASQPGPPARGATCSDPDADLRGTKSKRRCS